MNIAAARAAIRRGSNIRIFCPASHGAWSKASGTCVVFPAPGGASSTTRERAKSAACSAGNASKIGRIGWEVNADKAVVGRIKRPAL